ncbi:class F sortase [Prauserella muralis]|uniref:Sortase n=1 Tax=Prauserella muralis TaxID=588067 RepID=A0A2V4AZ67_9PSEU|nr:class F sortase [Prauserella muralis]PXY21230.1 sortase [Prauserella muralis]TWE30340.1 sortase family protein [Prauserella muralis]
MTHSRHGRRGWVTAYLLGIGSVLAAELVVLGVLLVPAPTVAVAGSAQPATTTRAAPAGTGEPEEAPTATSPAPRQDRATSTRPRPPAPPPAAEPRSRDEPVSSGRRPGTLALPDGGTARLVRQEVGPGAVLPVPERLGEATWWGAGLGAPSGAGVFAGHVNWNGRTGPFAELWNVRIGERITVTDAAGTVWRYAVAQIVTLHKDELPARAPELFSQSGPHRIVLVTCGGQWLGGTTGYADNRVVVAEPA